MIEQPGSTDVDAPAIEDALGRIVSLIATGVARDPTLIPAVRTLAAWLTSLVEEVEKPPPAAAPSPFKPTGVVPLRIGTQVIEVPVSGSAAEIQAAADAKPEVAESTQIEIPPETPARVIDLGLVIQRCELKVESCRWARERRQRITGGADFDSLIKPTDSDLLERGRALDDCWLWALDPYSSLPDDSEIDDIAGSFENLAAIVTIVRDLVADDRLAEAHRDEAYELLAEAQSSVRIAMEGNCNKPDVDQMDTFGWLKVRTFEDRVFVPRYMKLSDPADPHNWADLADRIKALADRVGDQKRSARERRNLLGKVRYTVDRMGDWGAEGRVRQWQTLYDTVERLVELGVRPSSRELRDLLLPIIDSYPDEEQPEPGPGMRGALAAIDEYIASRESQTEMEETVRPVSPILANARDLVRGRTLLIIGGDHRPHAAANLKRDLELADVQWIRTIPHMSNSAFEPHIASRDVDIVILAIRWSSHSFEGVRPMCLRYGKPYIRLPGGYGSNSVAKAIMDQISEELGGTPMRSSGPEDSP
ncbi:MAG: hypothetical protein KDA21_14900 [Phycisphaerales bacterium]|nr:hypothetical protein [Phycisphaerales bacterium]